MTGLTNKDFVAELPDEWTDKRADFLCYTARKTVEPKLMEAEDIWHYSIPNVQGNGGAQLEPAASIESSKILIEHDTLLVSKLNPRKKTICIATPGADSPTVASSEFVAVQSDKIDRRYALYVWSSEKVTDRLSAIVQSVTRSHQRVNPADITKLPWRWPGLDTQRRIARYLDNKTARIDALIEKKRALLNRLAENRQALITSAVTRGLNPAAILKSSGIDWLGKVPTHWEVKPVKRVAKLESGHTPDKQHEDYWGGDIPWVSLNDTAAIRSGDYIEDTAYCITPEGIANSSARLLPARAVVFTRDATIGEAAITKRPMAVSQHIIAWVCPEKLLAPEFLLYVIYGMRGELLRITNGTTIGTIGMGDVKSICIALPPHDEQMKIVEYVTDKKTRMERLIGRVETSIEKLIEYRAALVTAAVTGKIGALLTDVSKGSRPMQVGGENEEESHSAKER